MRGVLINYLSRPVSDIAVNILDAVWLGLIQGLTEWLPISSSGHLAIAQHFMERPPLVFDIMVHIGTLFVIMYYFREDLSRIRKAVLTTFAEMRKGRSFREVVYSDPHRRMAWFVVIGIVPTAAWGLLLNFTIIDMLYDSLLIVGSCLVLTGIILVLTARVRGRRRIMRMDSDDAWAVGFAQGLAILPGISRSGATIGVALLRGIDAETAGRYSFILAIPGIVGAMVLHIPDLFSGAGDIDVPAFIVGTVVAMVVGYATLALLMRILKGRGFHHFALYCWAVGAIVIWAGASGL